MYGKLRERIGPISGAFTQWHRRWPGIMHHVLSTVISYRLKSQRLWQVISAATSVAVAGIDALRSFEAKLNQVVTLTFVERLRSNLAGKGQRRPRNRASGASSSVTRWPCAIPRALRIDKRFALPITSVDPSSSGRRVGALWPYDQDRRRHRLRDDQLSGAMELDTSRATPVLTGPFRPGPATEGMFQFQKPGRS